MSLDDILRVSWSVSESLDKLLLYDAIQNNFERPSEKFWILLLPTASYVQCSSLCLTETLQNLTDSTLLTFFTTLHAHLHSFINAQPANVRKRVLKKLKRIRNSVLRKQRIKLFKANKMLWCDFEGDLVFNGNITNIHQIWNFPFI